MNQTYPTKNWRNGYTYTQLSPFTSRFKQKDEIIAIAPGGGEFATCERPDAMIEITGGFESLQRERRHITVYDEDGREMGSFPTQETPECLGFSLCGRLACYGAGWVEVFGLNEHDQLISVEKLVDSSFEFISQGNLVLVGFSPSKHSFFAYVWECGTKIDKNNVQVLEFAAPAELKYSSFILRRAERPGEVLVDELTRGMPPITPRNGPIEVVCISATGAIYRVRPARAAGETDCEELRDPVVMGRRTLMEKDLEERFTAIVAHVGDSYATFGGLTTRVGFAEEFARYNQQDDREKAGVENKDFNTLLKEMRKELGSNFDSNMLYAKTGTIAVLRIYTESFENVILEFELKREMNGYSGLHPLKLLWVGVESPVIVCRAKDPLCSVAVVPLSKEQAYCFKLTDVPEVPPCCSEPDGARFITTSVELLKPVISPELDLFSPERAGSILAHLFESYRSFDSGEFDSDALARTLEERSGGLRALILKALEAAEYEHEVSWAQEIYRAVRYLKLFLDENVKVDDMSVAEQYVSRRVLEEGEEYSWVSAGFLPVLKTLITGTEESVLYPEGQLLHFSEGFVFLDSNTTTEPFTAFNYEEYLTDAFVVSNKLSEIREFLQESEIYITIPEIRYIGLNNLISRLTMLQRHSLAAKVCDIFGMQENAVALDWIRELLHINPHASNEELLTKLHQKRAEIPTLEYRKIALVVVENGRPKLARMLLESEVSIEAKVELNLAVGDFAAAIETALHGGNASLAASATAVAAESPQGVKELIFYLFQNYEALHAFLAENRTARADLVYSLGAAAIPQNAALMAESQFRKAFEVKSAKRASALIEEAATLSEEAKAQYFEHLTAMKREKFDSISLRAATDGAFEQISATLAEQSGEQDQFDPYCYVDCELEMYEDSMHRCGPTGLAAICKEMETLSELQREASEQLGKNLMGLTVIDTLAALYALKSPLFEEVCSKLHVDPRIQFAGKFLGISKTPDRLVEIEELNGERVIPAKFAFYASKYLNSMSAAALYCGMIKDPKMRFRMHLMIREDLECVKIFRQVGYEGLCEISQEFYGNATATTLIKKLMGELELIGEDISAPSLSKK